MPPSDMSANTLPLDPYTEEGLVFWKALMYNYSFNERKNNIYLESSVRIVHTSSAIMQEDDGASHSVDW